VSFEIRSQSKGRRTRRRIVERAAILFNTRGVAGASMADVSEAAGLEKGGVYNHFATKQELACEAFDYAANLVYDRIEAAMATQGDALGKLRAFLDLYRRSAERPLIAGGCPLMNTAIEADDTNPELRRRARAAIERWRGLIVKTLEAGMRTGDIARVDADAVASTIVATIEGGVMLTKLYGDGVHIRAAVGHLETFTDSIDTSARARSV
jgi:TetR/AcrR family transcriptional repressor of nem operon